MKKWIKELAPYVIILVVVLILKTFVVTIVRVNGSSMVPNLKNGDIMILDRISYRFRPIERFDIVVADGSNTHLIKRVIGLPGDEVVYQDNVLYINKEKVEEPFEHFETEDFSLEVLNAKKVPEEYYLLVGDNRIDSLDSRSPRVGFIAQKDILGKTNFTIFPFDRFGKK